MVMKVYKGCISGIQYDCFAYLKKYINVQYEGVRCQVSGVRSQCETFHFSVYIFRYQLATLNIVLIKPF